MPVAVPVALGALINAEPDAAAVTDATGTWTRAELDLRATQLAHLFAHLGVTKGDIVTVALPTGREFVAATIAVWKLGATPQPLAHGMPRAELEAVLEVSRPSLVVGLEAGPDVVCLPALPAPDGRSRDPLPPMMSPSWKAPVSGGSTGRPKVIVSTTPADAEAITLLAQAVRLGGGDTMLATAPLHHNGPFLFAFSGLILGAHVLLPGRFDAEQTLALIDRHHVSWTYLVPTMMSRISKLPQATRDRYDVASLHTVFHMAAPCPTWLKQTWIDWLGPERVWELYAGTEAQAATMISGTEWLTHPGSVGRLLIGEIQICDPDGVPVPVGTVGEVWMRTTQGPTYRYLGAEAKSREGGWESLGDLGRLDDEGYLYLSDRLADMVLVGGVNVYPAEVEAALDEHRQVLSCCVLGLPDDDLGSRLHALVQLAGEVSDADLETWCRQRLTRHKVPRTFERVDGALRDDAAKVRRSALRHDRMFAPGNAPTITTG